MASGGGTGDKSTPHFLHHAEANPEGGDLKKPVKRSDFKSIWRLSHVDMWSKLNASDLEKTLDNHPLMLPSTRKAVKEDITKWKQLTEQEKKKLLRQEEREGRQRDRQNIQRKYPEFIQHFSQYKEEAEQRQREQEERKSSLQHEITLGHLSQTHQRELEAKLSETEREIMRAKAQQEEYQKYIDEYKQELQDTSQEQDKDSKQFLEEALRKGTILARINKCILTGSAGTGKTHIMHLLLGLKPPIVRSSTPCAKAPIRVVSTIRIKCEGEGWVVVDIKELENILASIIPVLWDALPEDEKAQAQSFKSLFQQPQSSGVTQDKAAPTSQGRAAPTSQDSPSLTSQDQITNSISDTPKQATTSLLDDLVKRLNQLAMESTKESEESIDFTNVNWIHLIDSGGQPQFYDLFPIFIRHATSILIVQRLCDRLNDRPTVEYYDGDGALVGIPYLSPFTNLETVMCLARTMHSHPTEGKHPKIMVACTHRDMEGMCSEARAEKNKTLFDLLHPLFPDDLVLYGDAMDPIFPLNAKEPDEEDKRVAKLLRQAIESSAPDPVELPLWWYFLEIALSRLAAMLDRRILSRKECLSVAHNLMFPEKEFDAALQYFDKLNLCLHYPDILPDVVFSDPQVPLDKASELVQQSYKLREAKQGKKSQGPQEALEAKWLKFRDQGIVRPEFLKKFPKHYRDSLFTPSHLLVLFEYLLIFAPLTSDEYFMPSLLQMLPREELDKHRVFSSAAAPLVIHFPHGWPRSGIFCCLVVFLINCCKWQVCRPSGLPILVARNCIKFTLPSYPCSITLIDSFAQFEVHVNSPAKFCSEICPIIRQKIFDGIDAAAATLRYNNDTPHSAFFCAHIPKDSEKTTLHTATLSKDCKWCMCTEDEDMFYELNDRQTVWFDTAVAASDSGTDFKHVVDSTTVLDEDDLHEVRQEVIDLAGKWQDLGSSLGIRISDMEAIQAANPHSPNNCLTKTLTRWLRKTYKVEKFGKPTWRRLVEAVEDRVGGNNRELAEKIARQHPS